MTELVRRRQVVSWQWERTRRRNGEGEIGHDTLAHPTYKKDDTERGGGGYIRARYNKCNSPVSLPMWNNKFKTINYIYWFGTYCLISLNSILISYLIINSVVIRLVTSVYTPFGIRSTSLSPFIHSSHTVHIYNTLHIHTHIHHTLTCPSKPSTDYQSHSTRPQSILVNIFCIIIMSSLCLYTTLCAVY